EDRRVIRRVVAPPASPFGVAAPRTGTATEHLSSHHVGADVRPCLLEHRGALVDDAALLTDLAAPDLEIEHPEVEVLSADAERLVDALVRPRQIAVERDGDLETNDAHNDLLNSVAVPPTYKGPRRAASGPARMGCMRTMVWRRLDEPGMEVAHVESLSEVSGVQIGSTYELRWRLRGDSLQLDLNDGERREEVELGDADFFDLFASPFFNSLPVMRDGLLVAGPPRD